MSEKQNNESPKMTAFQSSALIIGVLIVVGVMWINSQAISIKSLNDGKRDLESKIEVLKLELRNQKAETEIQRKKYIDCFLAKHT